MPHRWQRTKIDKGKCQNFFKKLFTYFLCDKVWSKNFLFYYKTYFLLYYKAIFKERVLFKGMLRKKNEHFLKKGILKKSFLLFPTVCIFDFCRNMNSRLYIFFLLDKSMTYITNMSGELML